MLWHVPQTSCFRLS